MMIKESIAKSLEELMGLCFVGNRIMDRMKSQLNVKFVMPVTGDIIHHQVSHQMPLLADKIGDYLESRDYCEGYHATPADFTDYKTSREIFDKMLEYFLDLEKSVCVVMDKCEKEKDRLTFTFLEGFLNDVYKFTTLAKDLVDYSEKNDCTPRDDMRFDSRIKGFLEVDND